MFIEVHFEFTAYLSEQRHTFIRGIRILGHEQDGSWSVVPWVLLLLLFNKDKVYSVRTKEGFAYS